jgi:DNA-binding NtrC family response regulator
LASVGLPFQPLRPSEVRRDDLDILGPYLVGSITHRISPLLAVRVLAESIIEALGYVILSAANAREAIALLEQDEPIDILFTDINLPDGPDTIDGLALAQKAVELSPGLRVIYTSGYGQTDGMTALFVEAATFLPKPYTVKQLTEAVVATA